MSSWFVAVDVTLMICSSMSGDEKYCLMNSCWMDWSQVDGFCMSSVVAFLAFFILSLRVDQRRSFLSSLLLGIVVLVSIRLLLIVIKKEVDYLARYPLVLRLA